VIAVGEQDRAQRRLGQQLLPRGSLSGTGSITTQPAAGLDRGAADLALHRRLINRPVANRVVEHLEFRGLHRHAANLGAVRFHRQARADEIAVAVDVVDAADGGPELVLAQPRRGIGGNFAAVRAVPLVGDDDAAVCGAFLSGLLSRGHSPDAMRSISPVIEISASQKRSSSYFDSLSVGSTMSVPATGNESVGA
jgi:hypothetical protein